MKLHVTHRTRYDYAQPVVESFNEARLQPTSAGGQVCHTFLLKVLPSTRLSHYLDFYLNCVHFFEVPEPHSSLLIESNATVSTSARLVPPDQATVPMSRLSECEAIEECYDFLHSSKYIDLKPDIWRLAVDAAIGSDDVWQSAWRMMQFIRAEFKYQPKSTSVHTHLSEVLEKRAGVCQDFTHVLLGMCRSLKIPARYVSGYLYNGPTDELEGSQASHAWCEVFVPDHGWLALDPTNDQQADERYIKVAVGRDYSDIVPVQGTYRGVGAKTMNVEVSVTLA